MEKNSKIDNLAGMPGQQIGFTRDWQELVMIPPDIDAIDVR